MQPATPLVQLIRAGFFTEIVAQARRRMNSNFHARSEENPDRLRNEGSHIAPHRHSNPPMPGDAPGIDVPPGACHNLAPLTPHAVCYEVKPGPWPGLPAPIPADLKIRIFAKSTSTRNASTTPSSPAISAG
jgi:hypothetical protein